MSNPAIVALLYDFDKTLSTRNMQEYTFIPNLGLSADAFWAEANAMAEQQQMDRILAYMYLMIEKSTASRKPIRREAFVELGRGVQFFDGVEGWFTRINAYGQAHGVAIEHYIISSGLKEIIEGTPIASAFRDIYACEFFYDVNGVAAWPRMAVNYTNKTQYLFRINKGVRDLSDDDSLNAYLPDDERRVPFRNMIYIGDGLTDVPCMKLVKLNGGCSLAVYADGQQARVVDLLQHKRVDFIAPADYTDGSLLDRLIKQTIAKMAVEHELVQAHLAMLKSL